MPEAARLFDQPPVIAPAAGPSWSSELHGEVGAMHRAIEQQLLAGSFAVAVVPLPARPMEELLVRVSRAAGWMTLAGAAVGTATALATLLG